MKRTGSMVLAGATGGHQDPRPARSEGSASPALRAAGGPGGELLGLGQPPGPAVGAGEAADGRFHHDTPRRAERGHVVLGGRVLPHLGVHGRARTPPGSARSAAWRSAGRRRSPAAARASRSAVAGATKTRSAGWPSATCGTSATPSRRRWSRLAGQRRPSGSPTKRSASAVGMTRTVTGLVEQPEQLAGLVGGDAGATPRMTLGSGCRPSPARPGLHSPSVLLEQSPRGSRAARSTAASPAPGSRPAGRRTRAGPRRAGSSRR